MTQYPDAAKSPLLGLCGSRGILFDTELLLVLCIGYYDSSLIARFKKTEKYDVDDFELLRQLASTAARIYVSPQVLAELYNHAEKLRSPLFDQFIPFMQEFVRRQLEIYIPKETIIDNEYFSLLGFADLSMYQICCEKRCVLFTTDFKLSQVMLANHVPVMNYNHIRGAAWFG